MKTVFAMVLLVSATGASAQFARTGPGGVPQVTVSPLDNGRSFPSFSALNLLGGDITPTMRRQRIERAQQVHATFPQLRYEMAALDPRSAAILFAKAEHQARWDRVRARD